MKKTIFAILFLVLAVSVFAYSTKAVTLSDVTFGSSDQERDQTVTADLMITNSASSPVTITLSNSVGSAYQLLISNAHPTIPAGQTLPVSVQAFVPTNQPVGSKNIGAIIATDSSGNTTSSTVSMIAKNELLITKIHVTTPDKTSSLSDGDSIKVKPGDDVTIEVTVRNDHADNVDMRDITLRMRSDTDLDWDTDDDVSDLSNGDKDTVDETFTVPSDIDNGDFDVDITAKGKDENGVSYTDTKTITIRVERTSHEIKIEDLVLTPSTISCGGRVNLKMALHNTGSHDESTVSVVLKNSDLKLDQFTSHLNINQDDTMDRTYTFNVANNTPAGEYIIDVSSYYGSDTQSDDQVVSLFVDQCQNTNTNTGNTGNTGNNGNTGTITTTTPPPVIVPTGNVVGPSYGGSSFWNSDSYIVILVAAAIIILLLIIVLLVKFVF